MGKYWIEVDAPDDETEFNDLKVTYSRGTEGAFGITFYSTEDLDITGFHKAKGDNGNERETDSHAEQ